MIRGAIENVTRNRIQGWVWSAEAALRGRTVLAFLDEVCIGAGKVEGFRQDLKDAGLGDGVAGFTFGLTYPENADTARIVVKLEGSDALLLQKRSKISAAAAAAGAAKAQRPQHSLSSLQWMRARGWIGQSDYDFLRFFRQIGVYDRTLVIPSDRPDRGEVQLQDPADTAKQLLLLHRMDDAETRRETLASPRDLHKLMEQHEVLAGAGAVVALWARARGKLPVIEGSHLQEAPVAPEQEKAAVDYALGPDRLLFLDCRVTIAAGSAFPEGGVEAFFLAP
jgi:hypothetical protein